MSSNTDAETIALQQQKQAETYLSQGKVLQAMGKIELAIASYRQAIELNPQEIETHKILGDILVKQKRLSEAIASYQTAIKFHPKVSIFHHKLGSVFTELQNWDEAVNAFCRAIQLDPNFAWYYYKLGEALTQQQKWHQAVIAYQRAIEIKPDLYWCYKHLGDALIKLEKWSEAVTVYQFATTHQPTNSLYQRLGYSLKQLCRLDEAATIYQKAIHIKPDNFGNYEALLEIYMLQNKWSEASFCLRKSLEINRDYQNFGVKRGYVKEKVIALTYDDGPTVYTNQILEILDSYQVKATFFVVGKKIKKYPELVKLTLARGHELANHSYNHINMAVASPELIKSEIEKTDRLLRQLGVTSTIRFRPPYGLQSSELLNLLIQMQKQLILSDVSPRDYLQKHSPESIANLVINNLKNGSIILLHDKLFQTVKATEIIIKSLQVTGYSFKTIGEILTEDLEENIQ